MITGKFDSSFAMNKDELAFAEALDRAKFVAWWFRNPDKKPYSVRLVRGDHRNYFYPDFVVCLSHVDGQAPKQRLVENKARPERCAQEVASYASILRQSAVSDPG